MKKSVTALLAAALVLTTGLPSAAQQTDYVPTPVTISKDKVKENGKLYYSHVVLERQTLFSISKAYGVTVQDIYDANPTLKLEQEGLKTYQILLIPIVEQASETASTVTETTAPAAAASAPEPAETAEDYIYHTVKWYEDLGIIARKYGVSKEAIMKANSMTSPTLSRKQKLRIPVGAGAETEGQGSVVDAATEAISGAIQEGKEILGDIADAISDKADEIFYTGKNDITAELVLPFNASKSPSENNLDFYSGVLMAARELKDEGISLDLNVYDCSTGVGALSQDRLGRCDFVLGPISASDLSAVLDIPHGSTPVVSPLEPKAAHLADSTRNFIQAPSSSDAQCADLVKWLGQEKRSSDKIVLLQEKGAALSAAAAALVSHLEQSGLEYSTISYGLLEGKDIAGSIEKVAAGEGFTTRIVVASEKEAFVSDVVRHANLLSHRKHVIALYCLSKVRSFETIEVENLHNTNLHASISYYIDYEDVKVQRFLLAYRALFNTEPGPFAFQGYDTAYNFAKMSSKYGSRWIDKLDSQTLKGLQSDFRFERTPGGGYTNKAVRRIVYGPDFSIKIVN